MFSFVAVFLFAAVQLRVGYRRFLGVFALCSDVAFAAAVGLSVCWVVGDFAQFGVCVVALLCSSMLLALLSLQLLLKTSALACDQLGTLVAAALRILLSASSGVFAVAVGLSVCWVVSVVVQFSVCVIALLCSSVLLNTYQTTGVVELTRRDP